MSERYDSRDGRIRRPQAAADVSAGVGLPVVKSQRTNSFKDNTEPNVYTDVHRVLIAGMIVSTCLFILGVVLALAHHQHVVLTSAWIRQHYQWPVIVHGLLTFNPTILMMLATLLLILTPVARVAVSLYAFFVDRDYRFVVVTGIVFLAIVLTVILGRAGLK